MTHDHATIEAELECAENFAKALANAVQWQPDEFPATEYDQLYALLRAANRRVGALRRALGLTQKEVL